MIPVEVKTEWAEYGIVLNDGVTSSDDVIGTFPLLTAIISKTSCSII